MSAAYVFEIDPIRPVFVVCAVCCKQSQSKTRAISYVADRKQSCRLKTKVDEINWSDDFYSDMFLSS